jgi:hypothetical protein
MTKLRVRVGKTAKPPTIPVLRQQKLPGGLATHPMQPAKHREDGTKKHKTTSRKHGTRRGLALAPADADCCCAEALAASLRLAGQRVTGDDVLALHFAAGGTADQGVSIAGALRAAAAAGLAGCRPAFEEVMPHDLLEELSGLHVTGAAGLIIGAELPGGPHALAVDPSGAVWSWGELHDLAGLGAVPDGEAWTVTWP